MNVTTLSPIPANDNPFWHDHYHLGTRVAHNVYIMHATHASEQATYVIVVNTDTGERMRIEFDDILYNGIRRV